MKTQIKGNGPSLLESVSEAFPNYRVKERSFLAVMGNFGSFSGTMQT
jgi:hypothetical protein